MKTIKFIFIFIFVLGSTFTQNNHWDVISIQRQMYTIKFISPVKGWVFSGDFAYKTNDAGITWSSPISMNYVIGIQNATPLGSFTNSVYFVDSLYGWSAQQTEILLKTNNGGNSWVEINTNLSNCAFTSVQFKDRLTGWAAGKKSNNGVIAKTTNGGNSWSVLTNQIHGGVTSFQMVSALKGYIVYESTDSIGYTEDNWNSISYRKVGNLMPAKKVAFSDSLNGWVIGTLDYISKTTNSGQNWSTYNHVNYGNSTNLFFYGLNTGWIICTMGSILKTTNNGINWIKIRDNQGFTPLYDLYDINFKTINTGWVTTYGGILLKTTNGGVNWSNEISPIQGIITSIDFSDNNFGWALSRYWVSNDEASFLWKSTDRGYYWNKVDTFTNVTMNSLDFVNNNTGFVCGNGGMLFKTTDSGNNLFNISPGSNSFYSVFFLNNNTGYVCGSEGSIFKTINGGINWQSQNSGFTQNLNDIQFIDGNYGFIAADSGKFLKTTNGGVNWSSSFPIDNYTYRAVNFVNMNTGYLTGDGHGNIPYPVSNRIILKTTNGGLYWSAVQNDHLGGYCYYWDIKFIDQNTGYVTAENNVNGYIIKSTNGGLNWIQDFGPIGLSTNVPGGITCIAVNDIDHMWAGGNNGTIISNVSPLGISSINSLIPENYSLFQNYPNPFNPQTKIKFDVPANVRGQTSNLKLVIYDLLGREVTTLVNEELSPGTYEADWDASNYSSGVYFYKIITNDFTETRKMVLMK